MFDAIILAVSPFFVSFLTDVTKRVTPIDTASKPIKTAFLRVLVVVLSLGASLVAQSVGEGSVDFASIETLVATIAVALSSTIPYLLGKLKKKEV